MAIAASICGILRKGSIRIIIDPYYPALISNDKEVTVESICSGPTSHRGFPDNVVSQNNAVAAMIRRYSLKRWKGIKQEILQRSKPC